MWLSQIISPKFYTWMSALIVASLIPVIAPEVIVRLILLILIFTIYSSAWNLLVYSGQGSIGHAAYFGVGAYISAILAERVGLTPFITIPIGGASAAVIGLFVGLVIVKLRAWFFGMATFAFAIIFQVLTVDDRLIWITYGWDGIFPPALVGSEIPNYIAYRYYIVLTLTALTIFTVYMIMKSRVGLAFTAIRENELEAKTLGINVKGYKLLAFVLSTFFSGIAGALLTHHYGYVSPEIFSIHNSFLPLIYSIAGGLLTIEGPIIGTFFVTLLMEGLRPYGAFERFIFVGIMLILILIFAPKGLTFIIKKGITFLSHLFLVP